VVKTYRVLQVERLVHGPRLQQYGLSSCCVSLSGQNISSALHMRGGEVDPRIKSAILPGLRGVCPCRSRVARASLAAAAAAGRARRRPSDFVWRRGESRRVIHSGTPKNSNVLTVRLWVESGHRVFKKSFFREPTSECKGASQRIQTLKKFIFGLSKTLRAGRVPQLPP